MTAPDERLPNAGTAEPSADRDPERLQEIAESLPIDPSPAQVDAYRQALGDDGSLEQQA